MSSGSVEVFTLDGGTIGLGCYSGTSDVMSPGLVKSWDDDFWNPGGWERQRDCGHDGEPVKIFTQYAGGFWWEGTACRECMVVKEPLSPYGEDFGYSPPPKDYELPKLHDGHPFEARQRKAAEG